MTAPRILLVSSRKWTYQGVMADELRHSVDSFIFQHRIPVTLMHAHRADPLADELWGGWRASRPDWFAAPVLWRIVESLERSDADVCLAFIRNHSARPTRVVELAQAAGIPVRVFREDTS